MTTYLESVPIIRGISGSALADSVLKYYDDLNEKYKDTIPLEMVYIPVKRQDDIYFALTLTISRLHFLHTPATIKEAGTPTGEVKW